MSKLHKHEEAMENVLEAIGLFSQEITELNSIQQQSVLKPLM
jgi:hypothetical protein